MIDFFKSAMAETAETTVSETNEIPSFFRGMPEAQDDPDTPVAQVEAQAYGPYTLSGEELLSHAQMNPEALMDSVSSETDAAAIRQLCGEIADRANSFAELPPSGGLLPEYQRLMEDQGYESESEMCNIEGLNWDEIYDDEPSVFGDEYKRGFIDSVDQQMNVYTIDADQYNQAYYQGILDAHELRILIG